MKYKLKVLSPLHIGCGEKYSGLNYVIHSGKMFCIDPDDFISFLGEDKTRKFVEWIETCTDNLDRIENDKNKLRGKYDDASKDKVKKINSALRQQRQNFILKRFIEDNKMNLGQITDHALYSAIIQQGVYNDSEINPFIKQMNHPYVPGTEIKGAIRTSMLYCSLLDSGELFLWLRDQLNQFQRNKADKINEVKNKAKPNTKTKNELVKEMAKIESAFQEQVLCCKPKDAKYDVMKYLQVGDSELLDASKVITVSYVKPFNIKNTFSIFYEYLKPNTEICLPMLALENVRTAKIEKMGFTDNQKNIVSSMGTLFMYCHRFSNDLIDEEVSFFRARGKQQIADKLTKIKSLNNPESPVLRIGKDEGYNSLTVGLAVKRLDKALYENVLIHATKNKSYDSNHGGPLPKSRKIVYWNGEETTAGWVQLVPENCSAYQDTSLNQLGQKRDTHKAVTPEDLSKLAGKFNVSRKKL